MLTTTAWRLATSGLSKTFSGNAPAWTTPGNVTASDNNRASVLVGSNQTSRPHRSFFGSAGLPAGAVPKVIEVGVERIKSGTSNRNIVDSTAYLVIGDNNLAADRVGPNKAAAGNWPTTEAEIIYTWTEAQLVAAGITAANIDSVGFELIVTKDLATSEATAAIDTVRRRDIYDLAPAKYLGVRTEAQVYRGTRTEAQISIGSAELFA